MFFLSLLKHININKVENSSCYLRFFEKKKKGLLCRLLKFYLTLHDGKRNLRHQEKNTWNLSTIPSLEQPQGQVLHGSCWRELSLLSEPLFHFCCRLLACSFCLKLSNCGLIMAPVLAITNDNTHLLRSSRFVWEHSGLPETLFGFQVSVV